MIINQTSKDVNWIDETGNSIPFNRTTKSERLKEKYSNKILKEAQNASEKLKALRDLMDVAIGEILEECRGENSVKLDGKGNYTWYNFNRSIRVEVNINELITFDEIKLESAKEKLSSLIRDNTKGDDFILSIVEQAFQTTTGKLDTKRILSLKKHTSRIVNLSIKNTWQEAMDLIDQSISRPTSKKYMKVYLKDETGEYQNIQLNFSSL